MKQLYTAVDLARMKGVTKGAIYKAIALGILKPSMTTNGVAKRFFDEKAVQQYLRVRAGRPKVKR